MNVLTDEGVSHLIKKTKEYVQENKTDLIQASFEVVDGLLVMTYPVDVDEPSIHIDENGYLVYTPD